MELNIKVTSIKDSKMDMEHFCGQMVADTRENSRAISQKDLGITHGWMDDSIKALGKIIKCMEEVFLLGLMDGSMKVNI